MKTEIKDKWVKALRSGEYTQGRGTLRKNDKFCCLGVLCDLYMKEDTNSSWRTKFKDDVEETFNFISGKESKSDTLPNEVVEWCDLDHTNPDTKKGAIAKLNDDGISFEELADIIENEF